MDLLLETRHASADGTIRFCEVAPCGPLRAYIACIWSFAQSTPRQQSYRHRVLPDGCTDIILNLEPGSPGAIVIGPMQQSRVVVSRGTHDLGVRFYAGAASVFLGHPLTDLQERVIPLEEFWGAGAGRLLDELLMADGLARRVAIVESRLIRRLRRPPLTDPQVTRAVKWVYANQGRLQVRELAQAVGLCERQLRRKFPVWTGYTPKQFVRVMRFQHALETMLQSRSVGDATVAAMHGYADQSHMIHEFHELGGSSPRTFQQAVRGTGGECPIFSIPTPGTLRYHRAP